MVSLGKLIIYNKKNKKIVLPKRLEVEKISAGTRIQKIDLAVRMVKTSPRGRNLKAAILVMNRNPVKKPRATTKSFSLQKGGDNLFLKSNI